MKKKKQAMKRHRGTYVKCKLLSKISPICKVTKYDSNYMTFWKKKRYEDNKKVYDCQGLEEDRNE